MKIMQYAHKDAHEHIICRILAHTAISIKVVPEDSGKVEYECERLLGIAKFLAIPISLSRSYSTFPLVFDFPALLRDNLN
jgi:hypothetical protein